MSPDYRIHDYLPELNIQLRYSSLLNYKEISKKHVTLTKIKVICHVQTAVGQRLKHVQ